MSPLGAEHNTAAQAAFPLRPLDVGKAWREMIHRYAASTLGLIIVAIAALAIAVRRAHAVSLGLTVALLATVVVQGILGMLTVTWQLKPLIVTGHLLFGLTTLGLSWWLWLSLREDAGAHAGATAIGVPDARIGQRARPSRVALRNLVILGLTALAVQIALGGWTSSNYAAIACPDFPTCQNAWWPQTDYRDAFVLWRGLWINYEGGILDTPARVAIHLTHRLGALIAALTLLAASIAVLASASNTRARRGAIAVMAALLLQLAVGIGMVLRGFPLTLATAHTAGAALLLLCVLTLLRSLTGAAGARAF